MTDVRFCRRCGTRLGAYAPEGMCPNCMLQSGLSEGPDSSWIEDSPAAGEPAELFSRSSKAFLDRFADYELLAEIGHGGMGVVYKARQSNLNRIVAVKMLLLGQFSSREGVQRFRREAESAAVLQHPQIVAIHEVGEVEGQPFYSMDYVEGQSLAQMVAKGPLPPRLGPIFEADFHPRWNPWITVDPATGDLYVVYYDSRNFPANDSAEVYVSASTDGGETFEDFLVSDVPFLPSGVGNVPPLPSNYMGSYIGISALQGVIWPCWNDNRTGVHQVYTSRIVFSPILGVRISASQVEITWTDAGVVLQESTDLKTWTDVSAATAPYKPTIGQRAHVFYRLRN